ncbi:MAG: hypothetical protein QHJ82_08845, partial [Verrucomicrobiota bacterium]|nr:hypothetical protein [Verrucomicrobiota bacterium]
RVPGTLFGLCGSAAVPGRINPAADRTQVSNTLIRRPNIHRLGAAKNGRAPEESSFAFAVAERLLLCRAVEVNPCLTGWWSRGDSNP